MIPAAILTGWRTVAPWADEGQVEQDLVLTRALVALFSEPETGRHVAFRGGTALHKLILPESLRYSEDIDLVQHLAGPIRPVLAAIQPQLDPWLGKPNIEQRTGGWRLTYRFTAADGGIRKVKVEINTREHKSFEALRVVPLAVKTAWFSGEANVLTCATAELLATKMRALYQRRKGRDLFDLGVALERLDVDEDAVVRLFVRVLAAEGKEVTRAVFEANLNAKVAHPLFLCDIGPLLREGQGYDGTAAAARVIERLIARLP